MNLYSWGGIVMVLRTPLPTLLASPGHHERSHLRPLRRCQQCLLECSRSLLRPRFRPKPLRPEGRVKSLSQTLEPMPLGETRVPTKGLSPWSVPLLRKPRLQVPVTYGQVYRSRAYKLWLSPSFP